MRYNSFTYLIICLILFLSCPISVGALGDVMKTDGDFVSLQKERFLITEKQGLPYFHAQTELESVNYQVRILYPEYVPLTKEEKKLVKKFADDIKEGIPSVETSFSTSRGKVWMEYRFCPIVKINGKWQRIVSCKVAIEPLDKYLKSAKAQTSSLDKSERYTRKSVLSTGKWVKIRVSKEGVYELTHSALSSMGFKNPDKVKLYGYGGQIQLENLEFTGKNQVIDDLNEVPLYRKSNSMLFFAEGTVRWTWNASNKKWTHQNNPYSKYSYYFITEGDSPLVMEKTSKGKTTVSELVESVMHYSVLDDDKYSWYEGGREFYDDYDFQTGSTYTFKLSTPGIVENANATVDIAFSAASISKATNVNVSANNKTLATFSVPTYADRENAREVRKTYQTKSLTADNAFKFTTTSGHSARLNFIRVSYLRTLNAQDAPFVFSHDSSRPTTFSVAGAKSTTHVWQIGNATTPTREVETELSGSHLKFYAEVPTNRFVLVDVAATYPAPEIVGEIANQNLHEDSALDMVIIVPASGKLTAEAERLAKVHAEKDGLRVKIVPTDQLYNEFSSGTPDATAYRRYLKMLYDKADSEKDMPKYLLLFGDCLWDNRLVTKSWSLSQDDLLLSYERNNSESAIGTIHCYVTDDYFGMLEDGKGRNLTIEKLDLAIGRFICTTPEEAKILVDKTIRYIENKEVGTWKNTICMLGDDGDNNEHMIDAENVVKQINHVTQGNMDIKKIYWDAYPRTMTATGSSYPQVNDMVKAQMKKGALMFNYSGHGSPDQISHSKILLTKDFKEPTDNMALWVFASCEITPYDTQTDNIGRAAMYNQNGGAIAVMCAARAVYADQNNQLNMSFSKYVLGNDEQGKRYTMGEAMRLAKVSMLTMGSDRTMNKLKYLLIGDPALTLTAPQHQVVLDSIDGTALTPDSYIQLKAGQVVRFSGSIGNGVIKDKDFYGILSIKIFDKEETVICKKNDSYTDKPMEYKDRPMIIYEGSDSIKHGQFAMNVLIPRDISYSNNCAHIGFYAVNTDNTKEANGHNEQFCLNGTYQNTEVDEESPEVYVYLNAPEFPDGGITDANPVFFAEIKDNQGITTIDNVIGHDMELVIDNDIHNILKLNDYFSYNFGSYKDGWVKYQLQGLTPGKHTLSFRVWDVNNNSTQVQLNFTVKENINNKLDVNATRNPARTTTHFITTLQPIENSASVRTEVYDINGRMVWANTQTLSAGSSYCSSEWRLIDGKGTPVPAGIYLYRSKVDSSEHHASTKTKKIIVIRQ